MFKKINENCYMIINSNRKGRNYLVFKGKVTKHYNWLSKLESKFSRLFNSQLDLIECKYKFITKEG